MALHRVAILSPNYSARNSGVRLVVLHTAEGALSFESLGAFFQNPASGVSSHVGIDDTPGTIGEYVRPDYKAWTQANANPYSVAVELCAFAAWSRAEWFDHALMLANCAQWVAEECARFGIPVRRLNAQQAQSNMSGVCQHVDLGTLGGSHWDCGNGFPMDDVLDMAAGEIPAEEETEDDGEMIAATTTGEGYWTATKDGAVYAFGDAAYKGNAHGKITGRVVGISGRDNDGYWLLASDGGVFAFGSAQFYGRPDRV
jgi:hypothetical protein